MDNRTPRLCTGKPRSLGQAKQDIRVRPCYKLTQLCPHLHEGQHGHHGRGAHGVKERDGAQQRFVHAVLDLPAHDHPSHSGQRRVHPDPAVAHCRMVRLA